MKRKVILTGLLVMFLFSAGHLEARGFGHFGARGFGHAGHKGFASFHAGARGHAHLGYGYHTQRFCKPGFTFGYHVPFYSSRFYHSVIPFAYYAPFYGYSNGGALDAGTPVNPPVYDEGYSAPPYSATIAKPSTEANCKDTWSNRSNSNSLSGLIHSVFALQCENAHPAREKNSSQSDDPD